VRPPVAAARAQPLRWPPSPLAPPAGEGDSEGEEGGYGYGAGRILGFDENGVPVLADEYDSEEDSDYESGGAPARLPPSPALSPVSLTACSGTAGVPLPSAELRLAASVVPPPSTQALRAGSGACACSRCLSRGVLCLPTLSSGAVHPALPAHGHRGFCSPRTRRKSASCRST
jgi:hypothetical protein